MRFNFINETGFTITLLNKENPNHIQELTQPTSEFEMSSSFFLFGNHSSIFYFVKIEGNEVDLYPVENRVQVECITKNQDNCALKKCNTTENDLTCEHESICLDHCVLDHPLNPSIEDCLLKCLDAPEACDDATKHCFETERLCQNSCHHPFFSCLDTCTASYTMTVDSLTGTATTQLTLS
jgi:hypothetical protein